MHELGETALGLQRFGAGYDPDVTVSQPTRTVRHVGLRTPSPAADTDASDAPFVIPPDIGQPVDLSHFEQPATDPTDLSALQDQIARMQAAFDERKARRDAGGAADADASGYSQADLAIIAQHPSSQRAGDETNPDDDPYGETRGQMARRIMNMQDALKRLQRLQGREQMQPMPPMGGRSSPFVPEIETASGGGPHELGYKASTLRVGTPDPLTTLEDIAQGEFGRPPRGVGRSQKKKSASLSIPT